MSDVSVDRLIDRLVKDRADIDNLLIAYDYKYGKGPSRPADGDKIHIAMGLTTHTGMSWFFSALEWIKWYLYDILSARKASAEAEMFMRRMHGREEPDEDDGPGPQVLN